MEDSKFNALISLLEDPDPVVAHHVEEEFFRLGAEGVERLENAWERVSDEEVQRRIEELISRIQIGFFTSNLALWCENGAEDLLEGWLLLNQIQYPTLNVQKYRNQIQRLVSKIWLQLDPRMNVLERLCVVNKYFYQIEEYTGNYNDPDKPDNHYLSILLDSRKGSSLSLSALYLAVCQQLEIPLQVINFVGYYAIRCYRRNSYFYVDAYNKGMFFTPQQVKDFLEKMNADKDVENYRPLDNALIIYHLLYNLTYAYKQNEQEEKAELFEQLLRDYPRGDRHKPF